jgi:eukaryotic-like serine/threonine-protein kinase
MHPDAIRGAHPAVIGRYQIVRLIGRGGMGDVYLARDPVLEREVAVKLISGEIDTARSRQRLVLEARAAGRLRHPNIVIIFDAGEHKDRPFIAMEFVRGETLGNLIRRQAPMPLVQRLELIEHACAGLAHAHRADVVHLDIKPDNLMLDETGIVKVLDFGIARVLKSDLLVTRQLGGTLRYMSPEQIENRPLDRRSDVFSLGCVFFELVTFVPAFVGSTKDIVTQISSGPVPGIREAMPGLEPRLDAIARRAMALEPSDRYSDLEELRAELAAVRKDIDPTYDPRVRPPAGAGANVDDEPTMPVSTSRRAAPASPAADRMRSPRHRALIATALLMTALVGAIAVWMLRQGRTVDVEAGLPRPEQSREQTRPSSQSIESPVAELPPPAGPPPLSGVPPTTSARGEASRGPASGDRGGVVQIGPRSAAPSRVEPQIPTAITSPGAEAPAQQPIPSSVEGRNLPAAPAPAPAPAPPPAQAPIAETSQARARLEQDAIRDTLRQYQAAYRALDVNGILQVYPSLARDQAEQLRRTFANVTQYEVDIRNPKIDVQMDTATVHAEVARRMTPRVGNPVANEVQTEFRLRREGSTWLIAAVIAR